MLASLCQRLLTCALHICLFPLGSVDGWLQINELKGTKPTEKISFFNLGVASALIIASCIKENGVLKELKCAARPKSVRFCVSAC